MKFALPIAIMFSLALLYLAFSNSTEEQPIPENSDLAEARIINEQADLSAQKDIEKKVSQPAGNNEAHIQENIAGAEFEDEDQTDLENDTKEEVSSEENIHFSLQLNESSHHLIQGSGNSDIGNIGFNSKLLPSNEVELSITLEQDETDNIALLAHFDLANFTMELDGKNSVLNKEHKQMLKLASEKLVANFKTQYVDFDFPDHAFMLSQMLTYWSLSPEGYVHEKRTIVSQ